MKAVLCPVCNGVGKVASGFYNRSGDCPSWVSSGVNPEVCQSCNGKGWVEVGEDSPLPFYWQPGPVGDESKCPACGGDRNSPSKSGCPLGSHYGAYCIDWFKGATNG